MTRYEQLESVLEKLTEPKKSFVLALVKDFVFLEEQIDQLRKFPRYVINPNKPTQQVKLPVHDMLKDFQAQKNDIVTKILRSIDDNDGEESKLLKTIMEFKNED